MADSLRFETLKDFEDWLARLRALPHYAAQTTDLMREGIRARIVHAKVVMQRVPGQIEKQLVSDPEKSPFYKPFTNIPKALAADRDRLQREARTIIAQQVVPAYRQFHQFFTKEYLPACFDQVGCWQMPDRKSVV